MTPSRIHSNVVVGTLQLRSVIQGLVTKACLLYQIELKHTRCYGVRYKATVCDISHPRSNKIQNASQAPALSYAYFRQSFIVWRSCLSLLGTIFLCYSRPVGGAEAVSSLASTHRSSKRVLALALIAFIGRSFDFLFLGCIARSIGHECGDRAGGVGRWRSMPG